jgi:hypothetical protein
MADPAVTARMGERPDDAGPYHIQIPDRVRGAALSFTDMHRQLVDMQWDEEINLLHTKIDEHARAMDALQLRLYSHARMADARRAFAPTFFRTFLNVDEMGAGDRTRLLTFLENHRPTATWSGQRVRHGTAQYHYDVRIEIPDARTIVLLQLDHEDASMWKECTISMIDPVTQAVVCQVVDDSTYLFEAMDPSHTALTSSLIQYFTTRCVPGCEVMDCVWFCKVLYTYMNHARKLATLPADANTTGNVWTGGTRLSRARDAGAQ